jgi:hypothetical protein
LNPTEIAVDDRFVLRERVQAASEQLSSNKPTPRLLLAISNCSTREYYSEITENPPYRSIKDENQKL